MKSPLRNLYGRLLIWFCAANIVTLLVSVAVTERLARNVYSNTPDWPELARDTNRAYIDGGQDGLRHWADDIRRKEGIIVQLLENGRSLLGPNLRLPRTLGQPPDDRNGPPPADAFPPPFPEGSVFDRLVHESGDLSLEPRPGLWISATTVTGSDGIARRFIGFRGPRPPHPRIEQLLLVQVLLSVLVIGVLGWWIARNISRPVAALYAATQRMAAGELSARVGLRWSQRGDELGRLSAGFDSMAGRIEALVAQERAVLQDVSHELRSPLARLNLLLDLAQRGASSEAAPHFERAEREIARLDRIIGEALALSRMEAQLPGMTLEAVDCAALLNSRVAAAKIEADPRHIRLQLKTLATPTCNGSATLLERALDNLLSNAIKFSDDNSSIDIELRRVGAELEIEIRDHGPGVPEAELAALFRPFFRGSNAARAEGHGLGLAIVTRIALAHGGAAEATNAEGGGLRVVLRLPVLA